jgi:hypothetical protein
MIAWTGILRAVMAWRSGAELWQVGPLGVPTGRSGAY